MRFLLFYIGDLRRQRQPVKKMGPFELSVTYVEHNTRSQAKVLDFSSKIRYNVNSEFSCIQWEKEKVRGEEHGKNSGRHHR